MLSLDMKVIDHEPWSWFLVEDGDRLLLSANCNHSAFGYSWLIELRKNEVTRYESEGRSYLNWLAHDIHYTAPGVIGSKSPYLNRKLSKKDKDLFHKSVMAWRAAQDA